MVVCLDRAHLSWFFSRWFWCKDCS